MASAHVFLTTEKSEISDGIRTQIIQKIQLLKNMRRCTQIIQKILLLKNGRGHRKPLQLHYLIKILTFFFGQFQLLALPLHFINDGIYCYIAFIARSFEPTLMMILFPARYIQLYINQLLKQHAAANTTWHQHQARATTADDPIYTLL